MCAGCSILPRTRVKVKSFPVVALPDGSSTVLESYDDEDEHRGVSSISVLPYDVEAILGEVGWSATWDQGDFGELKAEDLDGLLAPRQCEDICDRATDDTCSLANLLGESN